MTSVEKSMVGYGDIIRPKLVIRLIQPHCQQLDGIHGRGRVGVLRLRHDPGEAIFSDRTGGPATSLLTAHQARTVG